MGWSPHGGAHPDAAWDILTDSPRPLTILVLGHRRLTARVGPAMDQLVRVVERARLRDEPLLRSQPTRGPAVDVVLRD